MKKILFAAFALLTASLVSSCATAPLERSTRAAPKTTETVWVANAPRNIPLATRLNPIWWFGNDYQQTVDQAPWFHPEWPHWQREFYWTYLRNPMQNFRSFTIGVQDKQYYVTGKTPALLIQRNDLPRTADGHEQLGWQWAYLHDGQLFFPLPFLSYSGTHLVFYAGWQPNGFFGFKLHPHSDS